MRKNYEGHGGRQNRGDKGYLFTLAKKGFLSLYTGSQLENLKSPLADKLESVTGEAKEYSLSPQSSYKTRANCR